VVASIDAEQRPRERVDQGEIDTSQRRLVGRPAECGIAGSRTVDSHEDRARRHGIPANSACAGRDIPAAVSGGF
jgi:hypothetical protein